MRQYLFLLLLAAAMLTGCGPSEQELTQSLKKSFPELDRAVVKTLLEKQFAGYDQGKVFVISDNEGIVFPAEEIVLKKHGGAELKPAELYPDQLIDAARRLSSIHIEYRAARHMFNGIRSSSVKPFSREVSLNISFNRTVMNVKDHFGPKLAFFVPADWNEYSFEQREKWLSGNVYASLPDVVYEYCLMAGMVGNKEVFTENVSVKAGWNPENRQWQIMESQSPESSRPMSGIVWDSNEHSSERCRQLLESRGFVNKGVWVRQDELERYQQFLDKQASTAADGRTQTLKLKRAYNQHIYMKELTVQSAKHFLAVAEENPHASKEVREKALSQLKRKVLLYLQKTPDISRLDRRVMLSVLQRYRSLLGEDFIRLSTLETEKSEERKSAENPPDKKHSQQDFAAALREYQAGRASVSNLCHAAGSDPEIRTMLTRYDLYWKLEKAKSPSDIASRLRLLERQYGPQTELVQRCSYCDGSGKRKCLICNGKGYVKENGAYKYRTGNHRVRSSKYTVDCSGCADGKIQCSSCQGVGRHLRRNLLTSKRQELEKKICARVRNNP